MSENLIDQGFEIFERVQREMGQTSDEVSFVGGFMTCFGILTGRIPLLGGEAISVLERFDTIHRNIDDYRRKVLAAQGVERKNGG